MKKIYLDYAAATPVDPRVLAAMKPYFSEEFYNPAAVYLAAQRVRSAVESARRQVAGILGVRSTEIIFTPGATAANDAAIDGIMAQFPGKKLLVSAIEHPSVLRFVEQYGGQEIPVNSDGIVDLAVLKKMIDDDTVLVSVMYANSEVGTIQPLNAIGALIAEARKLRRSSGNELPLYFHSDASQAAEFLDLHVSRLGVDLLTLNGGKIYGPKQSGALYMRSGVPIREPRGTENVPGVVGFAAALELAQASRRQENLRLGELQRLFFNLIAEKLPQTVVNGSQKSRLPNNVHITLPGQDNERLLMALDEAGIMAAAGSACLASSEEPSHVLQAMGLSDADAQASLRFSMGRATTEQEIRTTVGVLERLIA